jgi:hypothetical protein
MPSGLQGTTSFGTLGWTRKTYAAVRRWRFFHGRRCC